VPQRIYDQYAPGDRVEIVFSNRGENIWQPAVVLRREPPGIWVQTEDGREWFMTNTFRIRPAAARSPADST
jgi:hypothetical protein